MYKYILDENDNAVAVETWGEFFAWHQSIPEDIRTGIGFKLARDESEHATVSTVYLGSDHGYGGGPPVLWETMVFCDGEDNENCERATSREMAMRNHRKFVEKYIGTKD